MPHIKGNLSADAVVKTEVASASDEEFTTLPTGTKTHTDAK